VKAVYLETFSDTIGAGDVVVAGIVMLPTKFYLADPLLASVWHYLCFQEYGPA